MLNHKQRENLEQLNAQHDKLTEALEFARDGKKPWRHESWQEGISPTNCKAHGEYIARTLTGPEHRGTAATMVSRCPACVAADLERVGDGIRKMHVADLLDEAGIARRFEHCEFANYQPVNEAARYNLNACQRYAETWPERFKLGAGLVMMGNCGTGKNHLAVSMAKNIIRNHLAVSMAKNIIRNHLASVEITDVMRLSRAVKNTWRNNAERTEDEVLEHFASLDLLIIDEVGVQFGSPAEMTILQEIINARYESILPTILISNLTFDRLKETIGERIVDRVTDGGRNRLAFSWESYRAIASGVAA